MDGVPDLEDESAAKKLKVEASPTIPVVPLSQQQPVVNPVMGSFPTQSVQ